MAEDPDAVTAEEEVAVPGMFDLIFVPAMLKKAEEYPPELVEAAEKYASDQMRLKEGFTALTEAGTKAPTKDEIQGLLKTIYSGKTSFWKRDKTKSTAEDPEHHEMIIAFWEAVEAFAPKMVMEENSNFLKDMRVLKSKWGSKSDTKKVTELDKIYKDYILIVEDKGSLSIGSGARRRIETLYKEGGRDRWIEDGQITNPRTSLLWIGVEKKVLGDISKNLAGSSHGFDESDEYKKWKEKYWREFVHWRLPVLLASKKKDFIKKFIEKYLQDKSKAGKSEYYNMMNIDFDGFHGILRPKSHHHYNQLHHDDIAYTNSDYSHAFIPYDKGYAQERSLISGESEILSVLAVAIIFVIGIVICFVWWLCCAIGGYYFLLTDQEKKKKAEKEDYDLECQSLCN